MVCEAAGGCDGNFVALMLWSMLTSIAFTIFCSGIGIFQVQKALGGILSSIGLLLFVACVAIPNMRG